MNKVIQIGKGKIKLFLFAESKKLLQLLQVSSARLQDARPTAKNQQLETEVKNQYHL